VSINLTNFKMGIFSNNPIAYQIAMAFVHFYKWIELLFFRLISVRVQRFIRKTFTAAGVKVHGDKPWDMKVHNDEFFIRVANNMTLGLGETYMEGMWDTENLVECVKRLLRNNAHLAYLNPVNQLCNFLEVSYFNMQTKKKAWEVGQEHYDKGGQVKHYN